MQGAEFAKYANLQICNIQNMNNAIMQNMKIFKNEDMHTILMCNMQRQAYQKKPAKPNIAIQIYQTWPPKPNQTKKSLPNQT